MGWKDILLNFFSATSSMLPFIQMRNFKITVLAGEM